MLRIAQYHKIPLPKGWPRRVRSAVIHVISLAHVAGRITPGRGRLWPARHRIVSLVHYTGLYAAHCTLDERFWGPSDIIYSLTDGREVRVLDDLRWADWSERGHLLCATRDGFLKLRRAAGLAAI